MKISYAILTHNEGLYIKELIATLLNFKLEEDEIVVVDDFSDDPLTIEILEDFKPYIKFEQRLFDGDASQKNYLNSLCSKDTTHIINIDSDEIFKPEFIRLLPSLLENNPKVELFRLPRVNTVEGLGLSQVNKWSWGVSKFENLITEKEFDLNNPQDLDEYNLLKKYNLIIKEDII